MDKRGKSVVVLSHCILNQNTVVEPLARAKGGYNQIIKTIINKDIGIHQLPCPECSFLGLARNPMNYDDYNNLNGYREACKHMAHDFYKVLNKYINNNYRIIGIIGINESPTCSITDKRGIFMEEIFNILEENNINLNYLEVSTNYLEEKDNDLYNLLKFLE